ncbi:MAG: ComEC/Rec2 family competence protein [Muribaculaceae bacterium]|nr:ComEC/Rec2 family competence protein [Muribaculaceae bacterium]
MRAALILVIFIIGILSGFQTPSILPAAVIITIAVGLLCINFLIKSTPQNIDLRQRLTISGIALLLLGAGVLDGSLNHFDNDYIADGSNRKLSGIIESRRTLSSSEMYNVRLREIDGLRERGELLLFAPSDRVYTPGDIITLRATLIPDSSASFLQRKFVAANVAYGSLEKIGESKNLRFFFLHLRENIDQMIGATHLRPETKALIRALIIADRTEISESRTATFRNGGVIHTLAVSGMHIAIIAAILLLLTRPFAMLTGRRLRLILVICGIWIFVMMTGASYPTVRAAIMISVVTAAIILERKRDPFSAVCLAALLIIAVRPSAIVDAGMQLSFVSVAALSLMADPLNPIDHRRHPKTYKLFSLILTTIIATAATWTLCSYYFGSIAVRFIPSNIILLPVLPFYVGASIIYLALSSIGIELTLFTYIMDSIPEILVNILDHITIPSLKLEVGIVCLILWMAALSIFGIALNIGRKCSIAGQPEYNSKPINISLLYTAIMLALTAILMIPLKI